jgi:hypothetical protein
MAPISPDSAAAHRSAVRNDPADPEIIAGRQVTGDALFSACKTWRYRLTRRWQGGQDAVLWLMLNPSTADAVRVDPTVRRAVTFSMEWGFASCLVGNVFALRATSPKHLYAHADPVGPDNDRHLAAMMAQAARIVLAWGNHAQVDGRCRVVAQLLRRHGDRCQHLGLTRSGMPKHPLYLAGDTRPCPAASVVAALAE